jgi:hypothetical protein
VVAGIYLIRLPLFQTLFRRPIRAFSAGHVLVVIFQIIMATILEGGIPATIEVVTNNTQNGVSSQTSGILSTYLPSSGWQIAVTAFLVLIAYDQCKSSKVSEEIQQQE